METADMVSMFLLGILGTGHCLGMCGPLVVAFPMRVGGLSAHLLYHAGRLATYTAVGLFMGGLGVGLSRLALLGGADPLRWIVRVQVGFSLVAALFLCHFGLTRLGVVREPEWMSLATPSRIPGYRRVVGTLGGRRSRVAMLLLGAMLGFLPCGLSFAAFSRALASGSAASGALLVICFGIGTVPGLLALGTAGAGILRRYRRQSDVLAGLLMIGMAAVLAMDAIEAMV